MSVVSFGLIFCNIIIRFFQFCFEAMEESGSEELDETLRAREHTFMKGVDFTCFQQLLAWKNKAVPHLWTKVRSRLWS